VVGCIEAAGTIVTSLDEAQKVLEGWRTGTESSLVPAPPPASAAPRV